MELQDQHMSKDKSFYFEKTCKDKFCEPILPLLRDLTTIPTRLSTHNRLNILPRFFFFQHLLWAFLALILIEDCREVTGNETIEGMKYSKVLLLDFKAAFRLTPLIL